MTGASHSTGNAAPKFVNAENPLKICAPRPMKLNSPSLPIRLRHYIDSEDIAEKLAKSDQWKQNAVYNLENVMNTDIVVA